MRGPYKPVISTSRNDKQASK